jgi:hypothetical protein
MAKNHEPKTIILLYYTVAIKLVEAAGKGVTGCRIAGQNLLVADSGVEAV